jgi:TMEM175 potassium channel family protein
MRALWVGLKSTVRCAIGRADQAPISAIDAWQLALAWLATGALVGALLPVLDVAVIAAFTASYCLPIPGESPGPPNVNSGARYHEHLPLITDHA